MSCYNCLTKGGHSESLLDGMRLQMLSEGKAEATVSKYLRDARIYLAFSDLKGEEKCLDRITAQEFRDHLSVRYKKSSVNSMIAGVNYLFTYCGRSDLKLQAYRIQRSAFRNDECELTLEEYRRLLRTASEEGLDRLFLIILTLGSTGIRISELPFITVESIGFGAADVSLKGKTRQVILPKELCCRLASYADSMGISSGSIFLTRSGRPVDRSNILHDMKKLSVKAGVDPRKVHPHNLRHLFAATYYDRYKDLVHLADILGHSNLNTTRIYTAIPRKELTKNIEELGLADI